MPENILAKAHHFLIFPCLVPQVPPAAAGIWAAGNAGKPASASGHISL